MVNLDYSWVWWKRNIYGFLEFYYNGLGESDAPSALLNKDILERVARGELFTLNRPYLGGHLRLELHPLFNVLLTEIVNLSDGSGVFQPRASWDITADFQLTLGGNLYHGGKDSEFGGFRIPGTTLLYKVPNSAFLWLTFFY